MVTLMRLLLILSVALLYGCATSSAMSPYRAKGSDTAVTISGTLTNSPNLIRPFALEIKAGNETILSGPLGAGANGVVTGSYQGKAASAECNGTGMQTKCFVVIDGEHAASLMFSFY